MNQMNFAEYLFENSRGLTKEVICGVDEKITYNELYTRTVELSEYISERHESGRTLILSDNSSFFIVAYLASILGGSTAVLTEVRSTKNELDKIIELTSPDVIFVQMRYSEKIDQRYKSRVINDTSSLNITAKTGGRKFKGKGDDCAIIIFTSGSTGSKKGVMLSHNNLIANTNSIIEYLKLSQEDRIEVVLPFSYCYGLSLLHTHVRVGASIVINRGIFLGNALKEMQEYGCTGFAGVPSTFQILLMRTDFLDRKYPRLRYITQAGGKLANHFIKQIEKALTPEGIEFFVMYGATEATARLSYLPPTLILKKLGSIGKGIPGVKLEVVDPSGKPIKPNEVGEIVAQGDNIMQGYFMDPQETNAVIRNGKYYTGDLAKIDEDGYIYIVGRSKNIIKSGGHRVSPIEIEEFIIQNKAVNEVCVFGVEDDIMGEGIVAVIETDFPSETLKKEIDESCRKHFPSYKIPSHIEFIDKIPLNRSDKKDYPKLRELLLSRGEGKS
jgi:acyl-CoA synthetase (AMP-forming)/AMP-acid ligase II